MERIYGRQPAVRSPAKHLHNRGASADILGPNFDAANPANFANVQVINGSFSVFLQSSGGGNNVALAQTGTIPSGEMSIELKAWNYLPSTAAFSASFAGNSLSPVVIGSGPNYTLYVYGADISSFAGQTGQLEITSIFNPQGPSWTELDDITFSPIAVTPEPGTLALLVMGGMAFGVREWRKRAKTRHE